MPIEKSDPRWTASAVTSAVKGEDVLYLNEDLNVLASQLKGIDHRLAQVWSAGREYHGQTPSMNRGTRERPVVQHPLRVRPDPGTPRRHLPDRAREVMFDVLIRVWDPILGKYGKVETPANKGPLTEADADWLVAELEPCVDDYQGQGMTLHSVRKVARVTSPSPEPPR